MSLTASDIQNAIDEWKPEDAEDGEFGELRDIIEKLEYENEPVILPGLGEMKIIDAKWGAEGGGDEIWFIFTVGDDPQTWRLDGWYNSYDGEYWETTLPTKVKGIPYTAMRWEVEN